jgi:hypothetical protein
VPGAQWFSARHEDAQVSQEAGLDRGDLLLALQELGRRAFADGKTVEIAIYGGSALMLTYDWRLATKDVDAVFEADRQTVRRLAAEVAQAHGWDRDWLNNGVKGFLSSRDPDAKTLYGTYPSEDEPGLRVMLANSAYLFAMKCRAMRVGGVEAAADVEDIRNLARELGIESAQEAFDLLASFYPGRLIEAKTRLGIEEIFDRPATGDGSKPS